MNQNGLGSELAPVYDIERYRERRGKTPAENAGHLAMENAVAFDMLEGSPGTRRRFQCILELAKLVVRPEHFGGHYTGW